ncbi:hypothetical protein NHQ30_000085 [Ciborinia camelliae]|nr:hypothetical protein NHQ30_000084 [Ciborinia camelliae]KAI9650072.1 hypothetical protein NHQ30_000085 [Ciborinia camelliae]
MHFQHFIITAIVLPLAIAAPVAAPIADPLAGGVTTSILRARQGADDSPADSILWQFGQYVPGLEGAITTLNNVIGV